MDEAIEAYADPTVDASASKIPLLGFAVKHLLATHWDENNDGKDGSNWIADGLPTHVHQYVKKIYNLAAKQKRVSADQGFSEVDKISG